MRVFLLSTSMIIIFVSCSREWSNPLSPDEDQKPDIPTLGLVAYYPFNGNANDESGNENHGTVNGATLTTDRFGTENKAYSFDGINDYIDIGNNVKPGFPITVSCWIKAINFSQSGIIFRNDQSNDKTYRYGLALWFYVGGYVANAVHEGYSNSSNRRSTSSANVIVKVDTWHNFITIFHSHSNTELFLDGKKLNTVTSGTGSSMKYSNGNGGIGNSSNGYYYGGNVDDIRVYNRALSIEEIQALYHEGEWNK